MWKILLISVALFSFLGFVFLSPLHAEEDTVRHEVSAEIDWISDEYTYDTYALNGEPRPGIMADLDQKYLTMTSVYTFFFPPMVREQDTPMALQRFYSHPSALRVQFSYQPEGEATYIHQNLASDYAAHTYRDESFRSVKVSCDYYIRQNTGLLFQVSSTKNEEDSRVSDTLNFRGTGEENEIRRYYGVGLSQYLFEHINIRLLYIGFNFERNNTEQSWRENDPPSLANYFQDTETAGKQISLTGEYVYKKFLGIQGFYGFWKREAHANIATSYYKNLPGIDSWYDDDIANHTFGTLWSVYLGEKTTVQIGGSYTVQELDRTYDSDQIVEHDWTIRTVEAGVLRYLNRYLGVRIGYEFTTRNGDSLTWHPASENPLRTTFKAKADAHAWYIGVIGKF